MRRQLDPHVRVRGTGSHLPERVVDNETLRGLVKGYDEDGSGPFATWVEQMSHIRRRRYAGPRERSCDLALVAARRALETAGVAPGDIGLIAYATFTPSQMLPGDHCVFAEMLGARQAGVFHILAACAGAIYGMGIAYAMIRAGVYEHVLVVGTETLTRATNFHDPLTAILFGDGAGAVVLSRSEDEGDGAGMLPPDLGMDFAPRSIQMGNSNVPIEVPVLPDLALLPGAPLVEQALIQMQGGPSVLRRGVQHMAASVVRCLGYDLPDLKRRDAGLRETLDRAWIVPHQANGRMLDGLTERLGVAPERVVRTIYEFGNMSAASNLVALDYGIREGNMARRLDADGRLLEIVKQPESRIRRGDLVLLPSIGGGYVFGCVGFVL